MHKSYVVSCLAFLCMAFAASGSPSPLHPVPALRGAPAPLAQDIIALPGAAAGDTLRVEAVPSLAGAISLRWQPVAGAERYAIDFSLDGELYLPLDTVTHPLTGYRHAHLGDGQQVFYRVSPLNGGAPSPSGTASATTRAQGYAYRVMPLGDSNTEGGNSAGLAPARRVAYRKDLYRLLLAAGLGVDFVGSERSGEGLAEGFRKETGQELDLDHAGFGGARLRDIDSLLSRGYYYFYGDKSRRLGPGQGAYLPLYAPDVILLHLGTNWVSGDAGAAEELERLLNHVDAYERGHGREVTVLLATLINRVYSVDGAGKDNQHEIDATRAFNRRVAELAERRIAAGDRLVLVDMAAAGLRYAFTHQGGDMEDVLHPNPGGYGKMADAWFAALQGELAAAPPVGLAAFELSASPGGVVASWRTSFESGVRQFALERIGADGAARVVGTVPGAGTSSAPRSYAFTDAAAPGGTLRYRLRIVTDGGEILYSQVATLQAGVLGAAPGQAPPRLAVYPNPGDGAWVQVRGEGLAGPGPVRLSLVDGRGRLVWRGSRRAAGGALQARLDFPHRLPPGLYVLRIQAARLTRSVKLLVN